MKALTVPLTELADYQEMIRIRTKEYGVLQITGCVNSQKTHLMYALGQGIRFRLGIYSSDEKAKQAYEEHRFLEENTYYYPAKDLLFYHADIKGKYLLSQRMEVVRALMELEEGREMHRSDNCGCTAGRTSADEKTGKVQRADRCRRYTGFYRAAGRAGVDGL